MDTKVKEKSDDKGTGKCPVCTGGAGEVIVTGGRIS